MASPDCSDSRLQQHPDPRFRPRTLQKHSLSMELAGTIRLGFVHLGPGGNDVPTTGTESKEALPRGLEELDRWRMT